jgi:hypothetical protein
MAEGANRAVYLRKTDGSPAVRLGEGYAQALSPDGKWAITRRGKDLVLMPTGAGEPRVLATPGLEVAVVGWFPDGKKIYYDASSPGKQIRLYEQDVAGGAPRPIAPEGFVGRAISPDGKFIAARNQDRTAFWPLPGVRGRSAENHPVRHRLGPPRALARNRRRRPRRLHGFPQGRSHAGRQVLRLHVLARALAALCRLGPEVRTAPRRGANPQRAPHT